MAIHHKPSTAWDIEFEDESTWANAHDGAPEGQTIGETASFRLIFATKKYPHADPPLPEDHQERFSTVLEHCRYAGRYALNESSSSGRMRYREQHAGPSLLVRLAPSYETQVPTGVWGMVSGYSSDTSLPDEVCALELDIDVLAPADEYATHSDVSTALEMRGP